MKKFKKLISVMLTVAMALAMSMTALAAEPEPTYTVTINNPVGQYEAYQIFAGDLSGSEKEGYVLSNIEWGSGVTDSGKSALGNAAKKAKEIANASNANELAETLAAGGADGKSYLAQPVGTYTAPTEKGGTGSISGLSAGYYLIRNVADSVTGNDTYTDFIVEVVGPVTVQPKGDKPEVTKKVQDTNDTTGNISGWQDAADYDIGDRVPFQLTGTLPSNYGNYDQYSYTFTDTLSSGLSYDDESNLKVYVVNGTDNIDDVTAQFALSHEEGVLTVSCPDLKKIEGVTINENSQIVVEYTALLNENAVLRNENKVKLTYSNDPTHKGDGGTTGETPEDVVIVFTYKLNADKIDGDDKNKPLPGAGFTLFKIVNATETKVGDELTGGQMTNFSWNGLDAGQYVLKETTTPEGYNTCEDIKFTIVAIYDTDADNPSLTKLVVKDETGEVISEGNDASFTTSNESGEIETQIANYKGSLLPSTGGIGTTIFYIVGAILVIGAGIILVAKKRMGQQQ